MSLGAAGASLDAVPHARRILSDVGERAEEEDEEYEDVDEDEDETGQEVTIPSHELNFGSVSSPRDFGTEDGEDGVLALKERLETVEAERDMLAEDVDGWRLRCKELEDKLAEEKRIGGVERDLARERIRKRKSAEMAQNHKNIRADPLLFLCCSRRTPCDPRLRPCPCLSIS